MSGKKKKDELRDDGSLDSVQMRADESDGNKKIEPELPLADQLKAAEAKAVEHYDRVLRVTAEFENYKKRAEREMIEFRKFANESLIKEVLPVVDNLERALAAGCEESQEAIKGLRDGVEMTLKGLLDTLGKFGVVPVDALGKPFDPHFHQAVSHEETDQHPDNAVSQELQKGYLLNDRLLRPAMVIISKNPSSPEGDSKDDGAAENK